jgi:uncharacterized protein
MDRQAGSASKQSVTRSRFELEEMGETAYLEFEQDSVGWITLVHTEVPEKLRGRGIAGTLAQTGLEYAREHHLKVDVICPMVANFISKHPEYQPLLGR